MKLGIDFLYGFECTTNNRNISITHNKNASYRPFNSYRLSQILTEDVEIISEVNYDNKHNLFKRADIITNNGNYEVSITKLASTIYTPSKGFMNGFHSEWCREFIPAVNNEFSAKNRTCNGSQPYFTISDGESTAVFHILPVGDWRVRLSLDYANIYKIAVDINDDNFYLSLQPGETYYFEPQYIVSFYDDEMIYPADTNVQKYAVKCLRKPHLNRLLPVVYNTWFDRFHKISIDGMLKQAYTAKKIGCEVFVVDAGWFGPGERNWTYVGDWRENPSVWNKMSMAQFSDRVRDIGLSFGVWMEPERMYRDSPLRIEHPEWFLQSSDLDYFYPDLTKPVVVQWILDEVSRVISNYNVKWIKLDCNGSFSDDKYGGGHRRRMENLYKIMDQLLEAFPETVFEACASGGLRADLNTLMHYHTHFHSDTVDPIDTINLGISASTRLTPGMESRWAVMYPAEGFTPYDNEPLDTKNYVLNPTLATGYKLSTYDISFIIRASMPGVLGFGGNIADLRNEQLTVISDNIAFYKKNRSFIQNSYGVPLTAIAASDNAPLRVLQLENDDCTRMMIFIYNTGYNVKSCEVKPLHLKPNALYLVTDVDSEKSVRLSGSDIWNLEAIKTTLSGQQATIYNINQL